MPSDIESDPSGKWSPIKELDWVKQSDDPKIRQLVEYSIILEGLNRNVGMHAAGVVIAPSDTSDYVPLYKSPNTELMTMYNMGDLEEAGLLKMDFLGLITLSVIDRASTLVQQTRGVDLDIEDIPSRRRENLRHDRRRPYRRRVPVRIAPACATGSRSSNRDPSTIWRR
jgi:DNA polymerase III alpha subunit